jgi:hypothetical protein
MPLDPKLVRCHDATCIQKDKCLRWIERHTGENHVATIRVFSGFCQGFIGKDSVWNTKPERFF